MRCTLGSCGESASCNYNTILMEHVRTMWLLDINFDCAGKEKILFLIILVYLRRGYWMIDLKKMRFKIEKWFKINLVFIWKLINHNSIKNDRKNGKTGLSKRATSSLWGCTTSSWTSVNREHNKKKRLLNFLIKIRETRNAKSEEGWQWFSKN